METRGIDAPCLREIFNHIAERIENEESTLNELDAAAGDGDHGITMRTGFQAVRSALAATPQDATIASVFRETGYVFMNSTGGAIGVVLGRMLMAGGEAMKGVSEIGPLEFRSLLQAMESSVTKTGKVRPGDKTLLDSLHASSESLASITPDDRLDAVLSRAADSAEAGATSTALMTCRVGRASRLGERSRGHMDPGAVSFSLMMRVFAELIRGNNSNPTPQGSGNLDTKEELT
jgi:dihydroxyacetone kinase phosphoprotein-dependent L subunit